MVEKEFNLSDFIVERGSLGSQIIDVGNIKEFIKRLKKKLGAKVIGSKYAEEVIDKLAGDKLI